MDAKGLVPALMSLHARSVWLKLENEGRLRGLAWDIKAAMVWDPCSGSLPRLELCSSLPGLSPICRAPCCIGNSLHEALELTLEVRGWQLTPLPPGGAPQHTLPGILQMLGNLHS